MIDTVISIAAQMLEALLPVTIVDLFVLPVIDTRCVAKSEEATPPAGIRMQATKRRQDSRPGSGSRPFYAHAKKELDLGVTPRLFNGA